MCVPVNWNYIPTQIRVRIGRLLQGEVSLPDCCISNRNICVRSYPLNLNRCLNLSHCIRNREFISPVFENEVANLEPSHPKAKLFVFRIRPLIVDFIFFMPDLLAVVQLFSLESFSFHYLWSSRFEAHELMCVRITV